MTDQGQAVDGLGRFGDPGVMVLMALSDGPKHGYAIAAEVEQLTGLKLGPGTLYGSLTKLTERGLIAALPVEDRRRPYEITTAGRTALAAALDTWSRVVETGRTRLASA